MMKIGWLLRLVSPRERTVSAVVGGGAALAGDLLGFFSDMAAPMWLLLAFGIALLIFAALCIRKAMRGDRDDNTSIEAVAGCAECDGLRFSLFGTGVFLLLALVGQGESATAQILNRLGVIEDKVTETHDDVKTIRDAMNSSIPIENPKTAGELYTNAYIYSMLRRDNDAARKALDELYGKFNPKKLDAAASYYDVLKLASSPKEAEVKVLQLGDRLKDPSFAIVVARQEMNRAHAESLRAKALAIDPEHPFAIWDPARVALGEGGSLATPSETAAYHREQVKRIDGFIERMKARSASDFYFIPQYQADAIQHAQTMRNLSASNAETSEKLAAQRKRLGF